MEYIIRSDGTTHSIKLGINAKKDTVLPSVRAAAAVGIGTSQKKDCLPKVSPEDPAFIIFTSGSTGKNKAVVLSEWNLISNLIDSAPLGYYSRDDIALGALPLTHVFGLALLTGALVLEYSIYFPEMISVPGLLDCIEREGITRMNGVPSLYLAMADESEGRDLRSLRAGFIGGGPVTREQFAYIEEKLGMTLISVYGMSECIGISCASYQDPRDVRASGVGPVYPMNRVRILDECGQEVPTGKEGEILVNGPMRMLGYYGSPLTKEEFFPTGDLGYLDETGVLHLSGRKKEVIIRKGNNLSPLRIEEAFLSLPGIRTCVVVGLPDEKEGEIPAAMIVGTYDESALGNLLHKNELPAFVLPVESIPLTASGKPDKPKIKEILLTCLNG